MTAILAPRSDGTALVKLCGMRRAADVDAAVRSGADLLGIVFAPSRRQVSIKEGRALVAAAAGRVPVVGVFVDATVDEINAVAAETGISLAQLSGSEPADALCALAVPYMKTIHVKDDSTLAGILHITNSYRNATAYLVDTWSPLGGGSGRVSDWSLACGIVEVTNCPMFVAGGLNAANVGQALRATGATGVDVSSGVEIDGWKDPRAMECFVERVRSSLHRGPRFSPANT